MASFLTWIDRKEKLIGQYPLKFIFADGLLFVALGILCKYKSNSWVRWNFHEQNV